MKILTLNYEFPPLGGGASPVSYYLAKELVQLGHGVDVVTMHYGNLPFRETIDGINIFRIPCIRFKKDICHIYEMVSFVMIAIPFIYKLVKSRKYDINHSHFIFPTGLLTLIIKKLTGLHYILTAHGSDVPGYNPERFKRAHKLMFFLWKYIVSNAKEITAPTNSLKSLILKNLKHQFPITVIPNGIYLEHQPDMTSKTKRILLVSRLFKRKGFQYFLRAIKDIHLDYEINIVGEGPYRKNLESEALQLGLKINFYGWLDNKSALLKQLYNQSEIFVFPSEAENFPIVLLEAMQSGLAIITSNVGGCPEVVGDAALLIEPKSIQAIKNALIKLINDRKLIKDLGQKARARVEQKFTWRKISNDFEKLFCKTVN